MAAAALHEGEVFAGRYRIVRELASGGMGAVYEVIHTVTERRCALKVMLSHTVEREQLRKRFMQESRLAAQIGSEYIVDVLDAGVDDDTKAPYLVMELLEGEDLGQRLLRLGPLSPPEVVTYLWNVALALDRTHQAGIVHRDLKASNLFLTQREDGSPFVKVLDFGVAKVLPLGNSGEQRTQTVGTPIYMAPEQFRADGRITPATDIYALGMLAFTLLVGVHYWTEEHENCDNPFAFASIAVHGPKEPPSLRASRQDVFLPERFDTWFTKATSRWPQDRFGSATLAVASLAEALDVEVPSTPLAMPPPAPGAPDKPLPFEALAPTVESPSARPTNSALVPIPSTGSSSRYGSGSGPRSVEQHTEISLSVTSGGLSPVDAGEEAAPTRRRFGGVVLAIAAIAVAAAVVIGQSWRASVLHKTVPAAPQASAISSAAPAGRASAAPKNEPGVTRIDELPIAPPEPAARDSVASAPVDRQAGSPAHKSRTTPEHRTGTPTPHHGADDAPPSFVEPTSKPSTHDNLYKRD